MKTSSPAKATVYSAYSPAETKLIQIAFKHMKSIPECDWEAIATEYGYKNATLARAKYGLAMNKYKLAGATPNGTPTTPPAAKGAARKRPASGEAAKGEAKRGRKVKSLPAVEVQENEDDPEEIEQKVKVEPKEETGVQYRSETDPASKEEDEEA